MAPLYQRRMRDASAGHAPRQAPPPPGWDDVRLTPSPAQSALGADLSPPQKQTISYILGEIKWFLLDVADAFERKEVREVDLQLVSLAPDSTISSEKPPPLSVAQLRNDLRRCFAAAQPFLEMAAASQDILMWKNPMTTLLLVLVYMYSIYVGYFWTLFFGLIHLQLSLNYLYTVKGIDIGLSFVPRREVKMPRLDVSSAQLVADLARTAQMAIKFAADFLEKLESMLTWKEERVSWHFYYLVMYWLTLATVFKTGTCFGMCGMTFGVRLFLTTYLFDRFPRLKYRLDTYGYFWRNLPLKNGEIPPRGPETDGRFFPSARRDDSFSDVLRASFDQDEEGNDDDILLLHSPGRPVSSPPPPVPQPSSASNLPSQPSPPPSSVISRHSSTFSLSNESSSVLHDDDLLDDLLDYRRCALSSKEGGTSRNSISGTLFLTHETLVFRAATSNEDRILFLDGIVYLRKSVSLRSFVRGSRKALAIASRGGDPLVFINVSRRDEFAGAIERACAARGIDIHKLQ